MGGWVGERDRELLHTFSCMFVCVCVFKMQFSSSDYFYDTSESFDKCSLLVMCTDDYFFRVYVVVVIPS